MNITINQQVALDEALVPHASRLRIGKSNFHLRLDITSKESTLQVVYDVLRLTLFYKAFLVTAYVPEIHMQEFWATATVHHHSIRFKMNIKKRIVNLEYFREMLHICPRIPNQTVDELLFEEEILAFLRYLGYNGEIKKITDVKINKLHQPWRSFAAVINKCLSGKSTGYDSLRLSQAQILWGMYHKKNVDFAYLLWDDFVYQVEHKYAKKSNEMYYPRFIKVIINFFMTKDPSIPRRYKVNWHYVRDDQMFTTIKLVSRHQNTQQFGALFPFELTNEGIRNSIAYKEYHAITSRATPSKTKASVRKTHSSFDNTMPPPTVAGTRLLTSAKGKQPAKSSKAKGLSTLSEVALTEAEQIKLATKRSLQQTHISQARRSGADEGTGNDDASHGMNVGGDKGLDAKDDDEELYGDVNINLEGQDVQMTDSSSVSSQFVMSMLNPSPDTGIDSFFELTHRVDVPVTTTVVPILVTAPTLPPPSIPTISQVQQAPATSPITAPSTSLQDLLHFGSLSGFDHRLKTLEDNFFEFMQTNQFAEAVSSILGIVDRYIDYRMKEAVKVEVQLQFDRLREEAQAENEDFLNKLDENNQKIINEQLKAEVLTRASNSSKTSYAVATDLSELELKKILNEKIESNKSIHLFDEQRNLYKAPVDACECDKIILDTYGDTVMLKRRRDDEDKDKEPFAR
nr:hypothetical protein [Tanacetum cinerariifolium]